MNTKPFSTILPLFLAWTVFSAASCSQGVQDPDVKERSETAPAPATSHATPQPVAAGPSVAGIVWTVPQSWTPQAERPMRVATYAIPPAGGDQEGAECAVFYFGTGQGGDVRSNIDRWIGQFERDSEPEESSSTINEIRVTTVRISGTYLAPGGPMMQSQGKKPGYKLIGAIVEAPEGAVFFKTTGPAATMAAAEKDIATLVNSVQKSSR